MPTSNPSAGASVKDEPKKVILTLVHGTWGRGFLPHVSVVRSWRTWRPFKYFMRPLRTPWYHPTSSFRQELHSLLPCETRAFSWCGSNSVFARERAAYSLRKLFETDSADVCHVIIAHSHGGNVALKALNGIDRASDFRIVTLATPFVRVIPRWWNPSYLDALLPALVCVTWLMVHVGPRVGLPLQFFSRGPFWILDYALTAAFAALPILILSTFIARFLINAGPVGWRIQGDKRLFQWRPHRLAMATNYICDTPFGPKFLVLRGIDDEAGLTLAFGSIGARVSHVMRSLIVNRVMLHAILLAPILVIILAQVGIALPDLVFLPLTVMLLMLTPGVFYSVFGREFALGAVRCEVTSNSSPDSENIKVVTLPKWDSDVKSGLRHALYDHPDCVSQIVLWLYDQGVVRDLSIKTALTMQDWARRLQDRDREIGGDPVAQRLDQDVFADLVINMAAKLKDTASTLQKDVPGHDGDPGAESP